MTSNLNFHRPATRRNHFLGIKSPDQTKAKRKKRITTITLIMGALAIINVLLALLEPAAPAIERNLVWIDTVKRGELARSPMPM